MDHTPFERKEDNEKNCGICPCQAGLELMTSSAEKCRTLGERATTSHCKSSFSAAAIACESAARSMAACIEGDERDCCDSAA